MCHFVRRFHVCGGASVYVEPTTCVGLTERENVLILRCTNSNSSSTSSAMAASGLLTTDIIGVVVVVVADSVHCSVASCVYLTHLIILLCVRQP